VALGDRSCGSLAKTASQAPHNAGRHRRFQSVQSRKEAGKVELHTRESSDSRTGETSERLAVEQLDVLRWTIGGARGYRHRRVKRENNPKTQVQTANLDWIRAKAPFVAE